MNMDKNSGFTILETLIAALVLALALAGVAGLIQGSFQLTRDYKDSITAAMLAQEGMEMVREQRDHNIETFPTVPAKWLDGLIKDPPLDFICDHPTKNCIAKLRSDGLVVFEQCGPSCPTLLFDSARGVFNHTSGVATQFTRSIHVRPIPGHPDEAEVKVLIEWPGLVTTKSLLLETHLFQWQL